jgi:mannose-6-phosphate isomerase-like protein (cupin superfamily)
MFPSFIDIKDRVQFSDAKLNKVALCESERLLFDVYCLRPGQAQRVHTHDDIDKVYVVLTGQPTLRIGDEAQTLRPHQAAYARAGVAHGVSNDGQEDATLLVFQARERHG